MATRSSILAWEIPRTEEPGGLQSMGLQRVRHRLFGYARSWFQHAASSSLKVKSESRSAVSNSLRPQGLHSSWNSQGQNPGMCNLSLLQGIFPTHGSNPGLLHCRQILYHLSHRGGACPGIRPGPLALRTWSLRHWTTRKVPHLVSLIKSVFFIYFFFCGEDTWHKIYPVGRTLFSTQHCQL